jgi:hypothetical protein
VGVEGFEEIDEAFVCAFALLRFLVGPPHVACLRLAEEGEDAALLEEVGVRVHGVSLGPSLGKVGGPS